MSAMKSQFTQQEDDDVIRTNTLLCVSSQWFPSDCLTSKTCQVHHKNPSDGLPHHQTAITSSSLVFPLKLDVDYVSQECQCCYGCSHMVLIKKGIIQTLVTDGRENNELKQRIPIRSVVFIQGRGAFLEPLPRTPERNAKVSIHQACHDSLPEKTYSINNYCTSKIFHFHILRKIPCDVTLVPL